MKIAIYMKFYVDAVDIFKCILSSPRFHTEKAKWSYVLKREGARVRHTRSETRELPLVYTHTTRCPPHQSPQHSVQVCSLSFLYSVWTCYKTVLKSYIEHLNSPGYLKLLGFTTCKHRVLFFLSLLCEKELFLLRQRTDILLLHSFSTFFHQVNSFSLGKFSLQLLRSGAQATQLVHLSSQSQKLWKPPKNCMFTAIKMWKLKVHNGELAAWAFFPTTLHHRRLFFFKT